MTIEQKVKKAKTFQVDDKAVTLTESISTMCKNAHKLAKETAAKASESLRLGDDVNETMPGVKRWTDVLESRKKWLDTVMVASDPKLQLEVRAKLPWATQLKYMDDSQFAFLVATQEVVDTQVIRQDGVDFNKIEALTQDERFSGTMVEIIFVHHGWYGNGFKTTPSLENMAKDIEAFINIRVAVIGLDNFAEKMAIQKEKAPIENVADLMPIAAFMHLEYAVEMCSTEHEIKTVGLP